MSDASDNQQVESETTVEPVKRRGRPKKRTPTKVVTKSKKPRLNETSKGLSANNELPAQQLTQHTVPQPPHTVPQSSHAMPQPQHTVPQPSQHLHTVPQPLHALHLLSNVAPPPQQTVPQPPHAVPQPPQTAPLPPHPGSIEGASLPTFVQFAVPPNFLSQPMVNSTLQNPLQHGVPSSLTAPQSSTLSLLSALQDDKFGLILPVLLRMEHKIDQIMAMIGAQSNAGISNMPQIGNQLNTTVGTQSSATVVGNQSNATSVGSQSNVTAASGHLNANAVSTSQSNVAMTGNPSSATANAPQANPTAMATQSNAPTVGSQSNASLTETHLNDPTMENQGGADTGCKLNTLTPLSSFNASKEPLPGMSSRQRIQLEMAKITEKTLPDDLNLPISRDEIIALHANSKSTMNFAVRLLRELFKREELIGRNLNGARGKERVDPKRVAIIKEIVFKIYRTSPSDKELLWRYCHKAMDSYLRKMQRPIVVQEQDS